METDSNHHKKKKKKSKKGDTLESGEALENVSRGGDVIKKHKKKKRTHGENDNGGVVPNELSGSEHAKKIKHKHQKHNQHLHYDESSLVTQKDSNKDSAEDNRTAETEHRKKKKRKHVDADIGEHSAVTEENTIETVPELQSNLEESPKKKRKKKKGSHSGEVQSDITSTEYHTPTRHSKNTLTEPDLDAMFASDDQTLFLTQTPSYVSALEQSLHRNRNVRNSKTISVGDNLLKSKSRKSKKRTPETHDIMPYPEKCPVLNSKTTSADNGRSRSKSKTRKSKKTPAADDVLQECAPDLEEPPILNSKTSSVDDGDNSSKSKTRKSKKTSAPDDLSSDCAPDSVEPPVLNNKRKKVSKKPSGAKSPKLVLQHRKGDEVYVVDQLLDMIKDREFSDDPLPLEFEPPLLHNKNMVKVLTRKEKEEFRALGVEIKTKTWSNREDMVLQRNMLDFTELEGIPHPALLLGFVPDLRKKLRKYLVAKNFYILLGKDLDDRPLHSVYKRARRIFSPYPRLQKMTDDDMQHIIQLQARKGNKWAEFASIVNRDPHTIESAVRWRSSKRVAGKWTPNEDRDLTKAVKKYSKKLGLKNNSNLGRLPWEKIAKKVKTRNYSQCYYRWVFTLSLPAKLEGAIRWNKKNDACLIYLLYNSATDQEQNVDWNSISEIMDKSLFNEFFLRNRWRILKNSVPDYREQDFENNVLHLYHHHLPTLLKDAKWTMDDLQKACEL